MNADLFWALVIWAVSIGFGRALKLWPDIPKATLPVAVIVVGWALWFVKLLTVDKLPFDLATLAASWEGIAVGVAAIGGHETIKQSLAAFLGEKTALLIVGKLPDQPRKK